MPAGVPGGAGGVPGGEGSSVAGSSLPASPHPGWTRPVATAHGDTLTLAECATYLSVGQPAEVRAILVVFVPFAFTPTCHAEVGALMRSTHLLRKQGVGCAVVSCDSRFTLAAWCQALTRVGGGDEEGDGDLGEGILLLSDFWPHGALSRDFGVFDERSGMAVRGTFLLDSSGRVLGSEVKAPGERRDFSGDGLARWLGGFG